MDTSRAVIVICVTLFLVIGFNAAIYVAFVRKNSVSQIELMRRAAQRARDPWQSENDDLEELSRLVKQLKEDPPKEKK
jgi:uncharacterized membrane protein affecting hemolysin expression